MAEYSESDGELFITQLKKAWNCIRNGPVLIGILDREECIQGDLFSDIS